MKKTLKPKENTPVNTPQSTSLSSELKTDFPLSEKDEIKMAEEKMRKAIKKLRKK